MKEKALATTIDLPIASPPFKELTVDPFQDTVDVDCAVTGDDFRSMAYYYDSGMFDSTTHNAAAIALRRKLKQGNVVRITRDGIRGPYICLVDQKRYSVSSDLEGFFEQIERGIFPENFHFQVRLPKEMVS